MKWYLTVCLHREESTCGGLETYSGRVGVGWGDECSSTETLLFLDFWFPKSQKFLRFDVLGHFYFSINSTFAFPQCCNVGSHGSNFDV